MVLTYKRGGSVKTGPTIFFRQYRDKGYGLLLRKSIEKWVLREGGRKVYCTATVNNRAVVNYLLSANYTIEAQLKNQYGQFDELIFGKILCDSNKSVKYRELEPISVKAQISDLNKIPHLFDEIVKFLQVEFSKDIVKINTSSARSFLKDSLRSGEDIPYEEKPKIALVVHHDEKILGLVILLPKRGGAIKGVISFGYNSLKNLRELIKKSEAVARKAKRHKIYFTIPDNRFDLISVLKEEKFQTEGILRKPYKENINIIVSSKQLS